MDPNDPMSAPNLIIPVPPPAVNSELSSGHSRFLAADDHRRFTLEDATWPRWTQRVFLLGVKEIVRESDTTNRTARTKLEQTAVPVGWRLIVGSPEDPVSAYVRDGVVPTMTGISHGERLRPYLLGTQQLDTA